MGHRKRFYGLRARKTQKNRKKPTNKSKDEPSRGAAKCVSTRCWRLERRDREAARCLSTHPSTASSPEFSPQNSLQGHVPVHPEYEHLRGSDVRVVVGLTALLTQSMKTTQVYSVDHCKRNYYLSIVRRKEKTKRARKNQGEGTPMALAQGRQMAEASKTAWNSLRTSQARKAAGTYGVLVSALKVLGVELFLHLRFRTILVIQR